MIRPRQLGSSAMVSITWRSRWVTASRSSSTGTGMSMTDRDQSLDRLVTWRMALLGTITSSPWAVRSLVTRRVISSTVPVTLWAEPGTESRMTSPKAYCRSAKRKKPARRSPTICWAPKPRPMPITVAGATSVVSGTPSCSRATMVAMKKVRATTTHSTASLTARERFSASATTLPASIASLIRASMPRRRTAPTQWANRITRAGPQDEHGGGQQQILDPVAEIEGLNAPKLAAGRVRSAGPDPAHRARTGGVT